MKRPLVAIAVLIIVILAIVCWRLGRPPDATDLANLVQTDPDAGLVAVERAMQSNPGQLRLVLIGMDAVQSLRRPDRGLQLLEQSQLDAAQRRPLLEELHRLSRELGDLHHAEVVLRLMWVDAPQDEDSLRELATLLLGECRRRESCEFLFALVKQRSFLLDELVMLGSTEELLDDSDLIGGTAADPRNQSLATVAKARLAAYSGDHRKAIELLEPLAAEAASDSVMPELHGALGRSLVAIGDVERLASWTRETAGITGLHPDVAYARAWSMSQDGQQQDAVITLSGALKSDPNHRLSLQLLGTIVAADGQSAAAQVFLNRARLLDEAERLLHRILLDDRLLESLVRAADLMEQLGRTTEAWAWLAAAQGLHPESAPSLQSRTNALLQRSLAEDQQTDQAVLDQLTLLARELRVKDTSIPGTVPTGHSKHTSVSRKILFRDLATAVNLIEPFFGGLPDDCRGLTIYQGFGGGVAVLDLDADSRADLCFVHGNTYPLSDDPRSSDRLSLQRDGAFADVSNLALPADRDFGQGIATGDFDNDGFDDLYVAAIGRNRLLLNNGDGTLRAIRLDAVDALNDWTTSCAIVDLTGDQVPDLIDINYAEGDDVFTRVCLSGPQQVPRSCRPDLFKGAPDRLLTGDGAGTVRLTNPNNGFPADSGRGLGVVIADLEERGQLDVFVSNDMTPNALLRRIEMSEQAARYEDEATLRGAATNGAGRIQAGMGIASGDLTGDGRMDFFVTNFLEETNTLYTMLDGGFFTDISARSGADAGSLGMLSFGTQSLDADRDGDLDLLLVNGHVDDFAHMDAPWKMTPAAYENTGDGFHLLPAATLTDYGTTPQLGRALARLDWNRDGLDDLVATHLDRAPALLQNESTAIGTCVRLNLRGTASCRTPFGAIVRATLTSAADTARTVTHHLTAGDGYYCANEHWISFAVLPGETVESVEIHWPSGLRQKLVDVPVTGRFVIVESVPRLFVIPQSP